MHKLLTTLFAAGLGLSLICGSAYAQGANHVTKKTAKAKKVEKAESAKNTNTEGMSGAQYHCEHGNKLSIYQHVSDESYVNLHWRDRVHRLERMPTTTGAHRYESKKDGLVLINIPAKSMLFDSHKGKQLANECRNAEQHRAMVMASPK